jgi:hypothetical protein
MESFVGHSVAGASLANSVVLACLLDHLVLNGKLTRSEVLGILGRAREQISGRDTIVSVKEASIIIGKLEALFSEKNV